MQVKKYMSYLKLRIRSNNQDLARVIFSSFYRSLLIYYLTPIYAAGAMNKDHILKLEKSILREHFGLQGITNASVLKVVSFYSKTTASIISKQGSDLRKMISTSKRAKAKKHFIMKESAQ